MTSGEMKMSRFKNVHPLMIYMPIKQRANLKVFARKNRMPVSQAVREGILMRMAGGNDPVTSASPPVFTKGTTSAANNKIFNEVPSSVVAL